MEHLALVEQAKVAIDNIYNDQSVPFQAVLGSLEELLQEVEDAIMSIKADIEAGRE